MLCDFYQRLKYCLLSLSGLLLIQTSLAQAISREETSVATFSEQISVLNQATGWFKDSAGQWHENDRAIGDDTFSEVSDEYSKSFVQGFESLALKELTIGNEKLYAFFENRIDGYWEYPAIKEDWTLDEMVTVCAFEPSELSKVTDALLTLNEAQRVSIACKYGSGAYASDGDIESQLVKSIGAQARGVTDLGVVRISILDLDLFPVTYEGATLVRFVHKLHNELAVSVFKEPFDPLIFDKQYYEVTMEDFRNFLDAS
jgi:hypothetical protein